MPKQTIEIDVPEGYEIDLISKPALNPGKEIPHFDITVYLKEKEPEFIEVREYLAKVDDIGICYRVDTRFHIVRPIYTRLKI